MNQVNPYFLDVSLEPLIGLADDEGEVDKYRQLNLSNEMQVKNILIERVKPSFQQQSLLTKQAIQLSLKYYLSKDGSEGDLERVFASLLLPFNTPKSVRTFFIWLWDVLFGDSSYRLDDWNEYKVLADINEPMRLKLRRT